MRVAAPAAIPPRSARVSLRRALERDWIHAVCRALEASTFASWTDLPGTRSDYEIFNDIPPLA